MKTLIFLLLTILCLSSLSAQQLHFCLSFTDTGEPIRVSNSWSMGAEPGYVYGLYKQANEIQPDTLSIVVSEEQNGNFIEIARYNAIPDSDKNWVAAHIRFKKGGDFKVSVLRNDSLVVSEYLTILTKKIKATANRKFTSQQGTSYSHTKIITCENFENGEIKNPSSYFEIANDKLQVTFLIQNEKKLAYEKFHIDIYKRTAPCGDYLEFVESKSLMPEYHKTSAYFSLNFSNIGEYKVCIYDIDMVRINTGYLVVAAK